MNIKRICHLAIMTAAVVFVGLISFSLETIITEKLLNFFQNQSISVYYVINLFSCIIGIFAIFVWVKTVQKRELSSLWLCKSNMQELAKGLVTGAFTVTTFLVINIIEGATITINDFNVKFGFLALISCIIAYIDESLYFGSFPITSLARISSYKTAVIISSIIYLAFRCYSYVFYVTTWQVLIVLINNIFLYAIIIFLLVQEKSIWPASAFLTIWYFSTTFLIGFNGNDESSVLMLYNEANIFSGDGFSVLTGLNSTVSLAFGLIPLIIAKRGIRRRRNNFDSLT